jgi:membrane-bound ClpP family serine protease
MSFVFIIAAAGLFLVFLEFFLPGAIMGIGGGLLLLASVVMFLLTSPSPLFFVGYLFALCIALYVVIKIALWRVKSTEKKGTIYSSKDQAGFQASSYEKSMIGKKGVAATDLRPSGHVYIDNHYVQATARGKFIEKGSEVLVVGGEGSHLIVKET